MHPNDNKQVQLMVATETLNLICDQWKKIDSMPDSVKRSNQLTTLQTWIGMVRATIEKLTTLEGKQAV
jgi:hypothetical protein